MILQLPWRPRQAHSPAELRRTRFQALLLAALKTQYYRPLLEAACLKTSRDIAAVDSIEEVLQLLPPTHLSSLRADPNAFRGREEPKPPRPGLFHPLPPPSRTAILMPGFAKRRGVKVFPEPSRTKLARYGPDALAGPVGALRRLAEAAEDRRAWAPRLTHSVIAFHSPRHVFPSGEARELFWRVFQVPVFSQFLGLGGELLAWECAAHDGMHIQSENAVFEIDESEGEPELLVTPLLNTSRPLLRLPTRLTAAIQYSACGCGRTVRRLIGVRRRALAPPAFRCAAAAASCAAD